MSTSVATPTPLAAAQDESRWAPPECVPVKVERLYRWFFSAAIIAMLTAGGSWGVWLLWKIGFAHQLTGASVQEINSHGEAQIYGWMGLFIMGFAYHVLPRFWRSVLVAPQLAAKVLGLVVVGILVRTVGMASLGDWSLATPIAVAGCLLELVAIMIFAIQMILTCRRGKTPFRPESGFLMGAMVWFMLMIVLDTFHTYTTMSAPTQADMLWYVATYQAPLRDLQIHGLALFMILGISSRMIPAFYGRPVGSARRGWWAVGLLTAAVVGEVGIFLAYRFTDNSSIAPFLMIPWILLCVGVVMQVWPWKLWRTPRRPDRSDKFIRIAYAWLALSLIMLLLLPVYLAAVKLPFSHAYYGAIRHAITVGFVSLMILGMSSRFVPAMRGISANKLSTLWVPFILINIGCFMRVSMETLTDWYSPIYAVIGFSGLLEITGFTWWAVGILSVMWKKKPAGRAAPVPATSA